MSAWLTGKGASKTALWTRDAVLACAWSVRKLRASRPGQFVRIAPRYRRRAHRAAVLLRQSAAGGSGARVLRRDRARRAAVAAPCAAQARGRCAARGRQPVGLPRCSRKCRRPRTCGWSRPAPALRRFCPSCAPQSPWQRYRRVILVHGVRAANELVVPGPDPRNRRRQPGTFMHLHCQPEKIARRARTAAFPRRSATGAWKRRPRPFRRSARSSCSAAIREMLKDARRRWPRAGLRKKRRRTPGQITVESFLVRMTASPSGALVRCCAAARAAASRASPTTTPTCSCAGRRTTTSTSRASRSEELDRSAGRVPRLAPRQAPCRSTRGLADEAAARVPRGLKREDLEWSYDAVQAQVARRAGARPRMRRPDCSTGSARSRSAHLEQRLAEDNRKFAKERVQGTMEERHKRRVKRNLERLEEWYGSLERGAGRARAAATARARRLSAELRDRDRKRRQAEFVAMLRAREADAAPRGLAAGRWEAGREPAYVAGACARRARSTCTLLLDLDRTLERRAARARRAAR